MSSSCLFFILGAGASHDSGLPTYRGPGGVYETQNDPERLLSLHSPLETIWELLTPLYRKIAESNPGPTYQLLKECATKYPDSFILTQNIDGHALEVGLPVVEMHGTWKTMSCLKCKERVPTDLNVRTCSCGGAYRPDIILYDETLPPKKVNQVYDLLRRRPDKVIVIGTTLELPYIRTFITKVKAKKGRVIHINPDDAYESKARKGETWYQVSSEEGLQKLLED